MFGEIAEALMDIAFSIFGFDIDIGNLGLTAKGLCDWTKKFLLLNLVRLQKP